MVLLHSPEKEIGFTSPDFALKNIDNTIYTLDNFRNENGFLVMFICNHCPYVMAIIDRLIQTCDALEKEGIKCVAIMSNDTEKYPDDSFENMQKFSETRGFRFPYLIDEDQSTARAYGAVCTPDFFGFNANGQLQYRGRLDSANNRPADKSTVPELFNAMLEIKEKGQVTQEQTPSMGCSIKWKT